MSFLDSLENSLKSLESRDESQQQTKALSYLVLSGADRVRKVLGETGIRILMRMMGLLLTAIGVQVVLNGLSEFGIIPKQAA